MLCVAKAQAGGPEVCVRFHHFTVLYLRRRRVVSVLSWRPIDRSQLGVISLVYSRIGSVSGEAWSVVWELMQMVLLLLLFWFHAP